MSTTGLFQASHPDGRSDWRIVFDLVEGMCPGEQISHEALMAALGTTDRSRMYRATGRANRELWATRDKSLASVKGEGYRVLHAEEMPALAMKYKRKSRKEMSNAVAVANATDLNALDNTQRNWAIKVQAGLHLLAQAMDDHEARINKHDDLIRQLQHRVDGLERNAA